MDFKIRSLSPQESRVVLALAEEGKRWVTRADIVSLLETSPQAADHIIRSLRRKGWLERASWGDYLLIPPEQGPEALGESNVLALASQIVDPYYIGFGTAAAHYGLTTQHRRVIHLVTPKHVRPQRIHDTEVRVVHLSARRFFGFGPVDVYGYPVTMSDREKTVLDCIDRPSLAGGIGEAALIFATAGRRFDWKKAEDYIGRIGSISLVRRFGWLADHIGAEIPNGMQARLHQIADRAGVSFFGPRKTSGEAIGYDSEWRLCVNVAPSVLAESEGLGRARAIRKDG